MGQGIAVHVIDDDEVLREMLAALLTAAGHRVHTYVSAIEFLDHLPSLSAGCVITDVQMPEMSGLQLLHRMRERLTEFPMIVLTGNADVPLAVEALKAGAADFIEKPFDAVTVLRSVHATIERLSRATTESGRQSDYLQRIAALTTRERDVLRGLVAGWSNKTIARELDISPRTVENYRANLMIKMHAASLSELVRMALLAEPNVAGT
jgi:two-component system response regulator FixJ